jgi:hypothetical protein
MIINSGVEKGKGTRNEIGREQDMQFPFDNFGKLEGLEISPVSKKSLESSLEIVFIP